MSDPTGQGNTPATSTFSGPEAYATEPLVDSLNYNLDPSSKKESISERRIVRKGETPGSYKTTPIFSQTYKSPFSTPSVKVGGEIKNLETEELLRLGKLAKKIGFSFDVDAEGNVTGVEMPKELTTDEDALRQELMEQKVEADILKKLIPLSVIFSENNKEADLLRSKIQDPTALALIEQLAKELHGLIDEVQANPTGIKLDEIRQKLPDFEKAVEQARNEIANPLTPIVPIVVLSPAPVQNPDDVLKKNIADLAKRFEDLRPNLNDLLLKVKDFAVVEALRNASQKIKADLEALEKTPSADFLKKITENIDEYNNLIADSESFLEGASSEQEKLELLKELADLASEVGQELAKAPELEKEISDKNDQDLFIELTRKLQDAFTALKQDTTREAIDKFLTRFSDYKEAIKQIEIDIAYRAAHPPKPLDVSSTWPPYIYFDKSKGKNGWFFSLNDPRNPEHLPGDQWTVAEANIKPVFTEYLSFMQEGSLKGRAKKVELYPDLVNAKNAIIDALKNKDPEQARALAEAFKQTIDEKKEAWKKFTEEETKKESAAQEKISLKRRFDEQVKNLEKAKESVDRVKAWQMTKTEEEALDDAIKHAENSSDVIEKMFNGTDAVPSSVLENLDALTKRILTLAEALDKEYVEKNTIRRNGTVLRPSYLKKVEGIDTRKIDVRGGGEMTVNDWLDKEEARKAALESKQRTDKVASLDEAQTMYEKALEKDPSTFLTLYVDTRTDPATGLVSYIRNEKLRKDPYKELIESALLKRGIVVVDPRPQDIGNSDAELAERKRKEENDVSLEKGRLTYSPSVESYQNKKWTKDTRTDEQKMTEPAPTVSLSGKDFLNNTEQSSGMVTPEQAPINSGAIENNPREVPAPNTRQEQSARIRAVSKLWETIVSMRGKSKFTAPLWVLLGSAIVAGAAYSLYKSPQSGDVPSTPAISSPDVKTAYSGWRALMNVGDKREMEMADDIVKLSHQELAEKYVPSFVKKGDTLAAPKLFAMENADLVLSPNVEHIPEFTDEQRKEFYTLIMVGQKVAQSMIAVLEEKAKQGNTVYDLKGLTRYAPQKWPIGPYFDKIKEANSILQS